MSLDSWQAQVFACRAKQKPLYLVESVMGNVIEACTSGAASLKCRAEQNIPDHFRVFKQQHGHLVRIG